MTRGIRAAALVVALSTCCLAALAAATVGPGSEIPIHFSGARADRYTERTTGVLMYSVTTILLVIVAALAAERQPRLAILALLGAGVVALLFAQAVVMVRPESDPSLPQTIRRAATILPARGTAMCSAAAWRCRAARGHGGP